MCEPNLGQLAFRGKFLVPAEGVPALVPSLPTRWVKCVTQCRPFHLLNLIMPLLPAYSVPKVDLTWALY
jgi:hypothetical protein